MTTLHDVYTDRVHPTTKATVATVFTAKSCIQCLMTKKHLEKLGVTARYVDVGEVPSAAAALRAEGFASLPVVFPTDTDIKPWAGFRPTLIDTLAVKR